MKSPLSFSFVNILLPMLAVFYPAKGILVDQIGLAIPPLKALCENETAFEFSLNKCLSDFKENIKEYASTDLDEYGQPLHYDIPESVLCCRISGLRPCIAGELGSTCGPSRAEGLLDEKMKSIYSAFRIITKRISEGRVQIKCDWDDSVYTHGSVICWPSWGHWTAGGVLTILAVVTIYHCCRHGCFTRHKK